MDSIGTRDVCLRLAIGKPLERFLTLVERNIRKLALPGDRPPSLFSRQGIAGLDASRSVPSPPEASSKIVLCREGTIT
jgi:hypothetical protein